MFAAILYGFAFKKYTLRDLDNACKFDLRFIYIMEQERPSYAVFCKFINEVIVPNEKEIFAKINERITKEVEIVLSESDAYIDGTKQEANANKYKFVWKPITFYKRITYKIESIINKLALINNYKHIDLIRNSTVALAISKLEQIKETIEDKIYQDSSKALLAMLEKVLDYEEKERICGPNRNSYYKTDNEVTAMAFKADYYSGLGSAMHAAYNVQNLVIQGFSFAYYISQSRADINDFIDVIEHFHSMYNCYPKNICADAGYGSLTNYKYLSEKGIGNYVKHQSWEGNKSGNFSDSYDLNDDETITCLNGNIGREVILENRHVKRSGVVFYKVNGCNSCEWMKYCKRFMKNTEKILKYLK